MSASAWIRNSTSIYSRGVRPIPHTFATPNPRPSPGHPSAGVDGLETDVCLTADGALVLLHDPYLPLGTDLKGPRT